MFLVNVNTRVLQQIFTGGVCYSACSCLNVSETFFFEKEMFLKLVEQSNAKPRQIRLIHVFWSCNVFEK
uniref:Uncharacterized protein n=1 Tax=Arundo donax TaxID=35708 RepID=A0A0A9DCI2_ARUDO